MDSVGSVSQKGTKETVHQWTTTNQGRSLLIVDNLDQTNHIVIDNFLTKVRKKITRLEEYLETKDQSHTKMMQS